MRSPAAAEQLGAVLPQRSIGGDVPIQRLPGNAEFTAKGADLRLGLAHALGRDYRRVHEDVEALEAAGLLDRDKEGVRADYDAFDVQMRVAL